MKETILRYIGNWHKLLEQPLATPLLLNLFQNANEIEFQGVKYVDMTCNCESFYVLYLGVNDTYDKLHGILMPSSCSTLDGFYKCNVDYIYINSFELETPLIPNMPTTPVYTNTEIYPEEITVADMQMRTALWGANKTQWVNANVENMVRFFEIPKCSFTFGYNYKIKFGLKQSVNNTFLLDALVISQETARIANRGRGIPPYNPSPTGTEIKFE